MNSIRFTLAALALSATAFAHASEVTNFPIPTTSTVSRAEIQAEVRRLVATGALTYNEAGPVEARPAPSIKTREEVRGEALSARVSHTMGSAAYFVGGM